jgi:hypothetical protein
MAEYQNCLATCSNSLITLKENLSDNSGNDSQSQSVSQSVTRLPYKAFFTSPHTAASKRKYFDGIILISIFWEIYTFWALLNMTVGFGIPSPCLYKCMYVCPTGIWTSAWVLFFFSFDYTVLLSVTFASLTIPSHSCLSSAFLLRGFYLYLVFMEICYRSVPSEY